MNTIERRISDQLRAYGEGLDMTTQDIDRLERELERKQDRERADRKVRVGKVWQAAVAACAVTGVVLGALALREDPAPPPASPPSITIAELEGVWLVDNAGGALWTFYPDGRMETTSQNRDDLAQISPKMGWTVDAAPGGFRLTSEPLNDNCTMTLDATITPQGRLTTTVSTAQGACLEVGDVWNMTRITPRSAAGASLSASFPTAEPKEVTNVLDLLGTWVLRGTGTILGINSSRAYFVLDGSATPVHIGTVTFDPDGSFAFASDADPSCTAIYRSATTDHATLEARLADGSCGRLGGTTDAWIRLN